MKYSYDSFPLEFSSAGHWTIDTWPMSPNHFLLFLETQNNCIRWLQVESPWCMKRGPSIGQGLKCFLFSRVFSLVLLIHQPFLAADGSSSFHVEFWLSLSLSLCKRKTRHPLFFFFLSPCLVFRSCSLIIFSLFHYISTFQTARRTWSEAISLYGRQLASSCRYNLSVYLY